MRPLLVAARRPGVGLLMAGFITGVVLTLIGLSVTRDNAGQHVLRQLGNDDVQLDHHQHHHDHHHDLDESASDAGEDVKVVDLSQQDRHKHTGQTVTA